MTFSQKLLDRIERVVLVAFWAYFTTNIVSSVARSHHVFDLLILAVELLTVILILSRRGANSISASPIDWALAFGATLTPLLVRPIEGDGLHLDALGAALMLLSIAMQFGAKLTLGRSFGVVPARREIVVRGPYKLVRHPIYASYLVGHAGFLLLNPSFWNFAIYFLATGLQIARLLREERLLGESPQYEAYLAQVRYRLVPGVF
jgi:protein-S-isoprenylcysteine O-methyltransferase Ste14